MYSRRILLTQSQIAAINRENIQRPGTGLALFPTMEEVIAPELVQQLLLTEPFPQEARYDKQGNRYSAGFYKALQQRMWAAVPTDATMIRHAVLIDNSFLRCFPTMAGNYRLEELGELDRFAVTLLKLGEPVLVVCQDGSGVWSLVQSRQCCGWMLTAHLAWEDNLLRWEQYCNEREQVCVIDSRRELDYIDFQGCQQIQLLLMGTRLPLYDVTASSFVVGLPKRDKKGNLAILQTLLHRDGGFLPGSLPFCVQNIVSQGKKMLGEPYGWGGTGYYRDCTSFIADLFSVFGLQFPRNSSQQMQMFGIEVCDDQREAKRQYIATLPAGSILYFPGHAMLYLGREGAQLEILHSVYAIGLPALAQVIPHKIRRVVQGHLHQQRVNGELLLDAITCCWIPERQKKFLRK